MSNFDMTVEALAQLRGREGSTETDFAEWEDEYFDYASDLEL